MLRLTGLFAALAVASALPAFDMKTKLPNGGERWALLIAGSNTWGNYRHQADIYHAYQIMKAGGLDDAHIVCMFYDDIANNAENPKKGTVINSPTGKDVYPGVPKDYTGAAVTAANFLAVLAGDKTKVSGGSGKVIASNENDHVFVYYSDHGGPGILGMPEGQAYLYGKDIVATLQAKSAAKGYAQLVFYIEACESGSIFEGTLPANTRIYATTASNAAESSWGCYCPGMDQPPPAGYDTCLGDLYSVAWMENVDAIGRAETLEKQFELVRDRVSQNGTFSEGSHVMQYGELDFDAEAINVFVGGSSDSNAIGSVPSDRKMGIVSNRDADLLFLGKKNPALLAEKIHHRSKMDQRMFQLASTLSNKPDEVMTTVATPVVEDWECYKANVDSYNRICGPLGNYGMKHGRTLANLCNLAVSPAEVAKTLETICA